MYTDLPLNANAFGTKLYHPNLTSAEVMQAIYLAGAAYANTASEIGAGLLGDWEVITDDLRAFGLADARVKADLFYQSASFPSGGLDAIFPGTAEAMVFKHKTTGEVSLAFRGTAGGVPFITGDAGDWGPASQLLHYAAFDELFTALDAYLAANGASRVIVSGHSLGAAMVELYMAEHANGAVAGVQYDAVAVASPRASEAGSDSRVLNYGHESDIVYSVAGLRGANAVEDMYVVFNENGADWLAGDIADVGNQHSIAFSYQYSAEVLLTSQFYDETDRDSRVIVSLTSEQEELEEVATDFFLDDPALILGRNKPVTLPDGTALGIDDILVGGGADDFIEGFAGDDIIYGDIVLFGDGGRDTIAGGSGADTFIGTPGELNGDTIVDLEVGDRFGLSGVTIEQADISFFGSTIKFDIGGSILNPFGTVTTINARVPRGASLVLLENTLEDGGSLIEVKPGGQDLAFVIDTTGSMYDDIDAVQASANTIIDAIFDEARGLTDSRIAIVGYNDPFVDVILPFTEQADSEDRKAAAISAINSISVGGGGDTPELTYTGILRALEGSAGEWRADAVSRKIVVFGDAPAKDSSLAPQVFSLASDVDASVSGRLAAPTLALASAGGGVTTKIDDSISLTTFTTTEVNAVTGATTAVNVQVYTVAIGFDPAAVEDFENIAEQTGGQFFRAASSSEIVAALLDVINLPIYNIAIEATSLIETNTEQTVDVVISRDVADTAVTVNLSTSGTADAEDVGSVPASVSFAEGEFTRTITLTVAGDTKMEEDETFALTITSISERATLLNDSVSLTIVNDDLVPSPVYNLAIAASAITETNATQTVDVVVTRDRADAASTVTFSRSGTASADDVHNAPATIAFAAGELSKTVTLEIVGDTLVEDDETFTFAISNISEPATLLNDTVNLTIANDDLGRVAVADWARLNVGDQGRYAMLSYWEENGRPVSVRPNPLSDNLDSQDRIPIEVFAIDSADRNQITDVLDRLGINLPSFLGGGWMDGTDTVKLSKSGFGIWDGNDTVFNGKGSRIDGDEVIGMRIEQDAAFDTAMSARIDLDFARNGGAPVTAVTYLDGVVTGTFTSRGSTIAIGGATFAGLDEVQLFLSDTITQYSVRNIEFYDLYASSAPAIA